MKVTIDIQRWLRKERGKAVRMKWTDFRIDKDKQRGQIRLIKYDDVAGKWAGYQV